jgi:hypothetical protein
LERGLNSFSVAQGPSHPIEARVKKGKVCRISSQFAVVFAIFATVFMTTLSAHATDCFRDHLRKASALNRTRRPLYSTLSNGRSTWISNKLLFLEDLALLSSHLNNDFDDKDQVYQKAGLEVLCEDFVSMDKSPPFQPRFQNVRTSRT